MFYVQNENIANIKYCRIIVFILFFSACYTWFSKPYFYSQFWLVMKIVYVCYNENVYEAYFIDFLYFSEESESSMCIFVS